MTIFFNDRPVPIYVTNEGSTNLGDDFPVPAWFCRTVPEAQASAQTNVIMEELSVELHVDNDVISKKGAIAVTTVSIKSSHVGGH